ERPELRRTVMDYVFPELSPIDDVRGTAAYRREAAREIVIRALEQAWQGAGRSEVAA
ncbi:MAG: xanthine dehydrogenase family protein subunit M, partial [Nitratireductor sp.]